MSDEDDKATLKGNDKILAEAIELFDKCAEREEDNRRDAKDDIEFARLAKQWPDAVKKAREQEGRPCLTINRLPAFIRQVINDARQNSPSIIVHPVDSFADPATAEVINGLIRNIEATSDADIAYDTALEAAVSGGFGYFRVNIAYADDDSFDKDICIRRIANQFTVYGDPYSTSASSDDWNTCFVVDTLSKDAFEKKYKDAEPVDWKSDSYMGLKAPWIDGDQVMVAEYWKRQEFPRQIVALSSGEVVDLKVYKANKDRFDKEGSTVVGKPRTVKSHKVTQYIMSGAEVLDTIEWAGKYIPIVPVYGEDINVEGKRHLRSMVRDAKDPQQMFNYWRTAATELVALAPKAPWIGKKGSFKSDAAKWGSANTQSHSHIEYDGDVPPERTPFAGVPAGALQEAANAGDDMKAIMGIFDASLGAPSNETSGRAILMRQREGDVGSFHFIDNLSRAIRHAGRIIIDLIPQVYSTERVVRVLGLDGTPQTVPVNQPVMVPPSQPGQPPAPPQAIPPQVQQQMQAGTLAPAVAKQLQAITKVFDLTVGKYDVAVEAGPSFTTQREAAAQQMMELIHADPAVAPLIGDLLVKNLDWPGADEIAKRLQSRVPGAPGSQGPSPDMVKMQGEQQLAQQQQQIDQQKAAADLDAKMKIAQYEAQTKAAVTTQQNQLEHERMVAQQQGQMQLEQMKIASAERIAVAVARINAEGKIAGAQAAAKVNDGSQALSYEEGREGI